MWLRSMLRCVLVLVLGSVASCTATAGGSPPGTSMDGDGDGDGDGDRDGEGDGDGSSEGGAHGSGGGMSGTGGGDGDGDGDGHVDGSAGVSLDLSHGDWTKEAVSNTSGTISHGAALAFTEDGTAWVAFAEPDSEVLSDQEIVTTHNDGAGWSSPDARSSGDRQHSGASLHAAGETVHLAWGGPDGGDLTDILYASNDGSGWSPTYNLTRNASRSDHRPQVVTIGDGALVVVYLSGESGGAAGVRALSLTDPSRPSSPEDVYTPEGGATCFRASATADEGGNVHFAAECGSELVYGTNESGSWETTLLDFGEISGLGQPTMRVGPDGTMHLAFSASYRCGDDSCRGIFYAKGDPRAASAVPVLPDGEEGLFPTMVVDGGGQAVVAFHRFGEDVANVYVSWSEDGEGFTPPMNATPDSETDDEWQPTSGAINPSTGAPEFVFHNLLADSNPVNSEVLRLRFVSESI